MQTQGRRRTAALMASLMVLASVVVSSAQTGGQGIQPQTGLPSSQMPGELRKVDFVQRLNTSLPLDLPFRDETGYNVYQPLDVEGVFPAPRAAPCCLQRHLALLEL